VAMPATEAEAAIGCVPRLLVVGGDLCECPWRFTVLAVEVLLKRSLPVLGTCSCGGRSAVARHGEGETEVEGQLPLPGDDTAAAGNREMVAAVWGSEEGATGTAAGEGADGEGDRLKGSFAVALEAMAARCRTCSGVAVAGG
jgi:hypothetical protein